MTISYSQHCHNRMAHQNASLVDGIVTYLNKQYTMKEFEAAYPVEGFTLMDANLSFKRNKKVK